MAPLSRRFYPPFLTDTPPNGEVACRPWSLSPLGQAALLADQGYLEDGVIVLAQKLISQQQPGAERLQLTVRLPARDLHSISRPSASYAASLYASPRVG